MRGLVHIGENKYDAGRAWELPSTTLSIQLKELGLNVGRLKQEHQQDLMQIQLIFQLWICMVEM